MSGDVGLLVNPKSGANVAMAGFGGTACAVAVMLVLFWATSPVFAQQSCQDPEWEEAGTVNSPYQIETLCELQAINAELGKHYVLMDSIDAAPTAGWNVEEGEPRGFEPIASGTGDKFSGSFVNGGGHVISSLYINRPNEDNVGLFSRLAAGATIRKVILMDARMTGNRNVGSLVGDGRGMILDSYATGSVVGDRFVGGLVGYSAGNIDDSYATGSVVGDSYVGGLAGGNEGSVSNSYATGSVEGDEDVGGLVGYSAGNIDDSYATGSVLGDSYVGGLAGSNYYGSISNSSATGSVVGDRFVGGLAGSNIYGSISNSSATGDVSGDSYVGGLAGSNYYGSISNSSATGDVSGDSAVGGLVGYSAGNIDDSYATGSVSGRNRVGGLAGYNDEGVINNSYAAGSVSGDSFVGGLAGYSSYASISNGYATGSVSGLYSVGGLVGSVASTGTISNSYATGSVLGAGNNVGGLAGSVASNSTVRNSYFARGPGNGWGEQRSFSQMRCPTTASVTCPPSTSVSYKDWDTQVWKFGSKTELPQLRSNDNPDLNLRPYIAGQGEQLVRAGVLPSTMNLVFKVAYAGTPKESVALTWTLSGIPAKSGLVYFDLGDEPSSTTASGSSAKLVVMLGTSLIEGAFFDVVLMNDVSVNGDRVRVRVISATYVQNQQVEESVDSTVLTVTAPEDIVSGDREALQWVFLVDGEPASEIREIAQFVGSTTGSSVKVELNRPGGKGDFASFVLRVSDPAGASTTMVNVNIIPECAGGGQDLMTPRQDGAGTSADPYQIWTLCQLQDMSSSPSAHYELATDIDARPANTLNNGAGFEPIASGTNGDFSGSFVNISNHVITGLTINRPGTDNVGLFSRLVRGATVLGVVLVDGRVTGDNNVGSLVGYSEGVILDSSATGSVSGLYNVGGLVGSVASIGTISNSSATGSVSGYADVGGLVGYSAGNVDDSYAAGLVRGRGNNLGGLVGSVASTGTISNSYATGSVSGDSYVGGLVGSVASIGTISNSYATGSVSGDENVGGLAGSVASIGTISNSYATGSVEGDENVGGLAGSVASSGTISNSYAIGSVTGAGDNVGGLVGDSEGSVSNSYATGLVTGAGDNVGGLVGGSDYGSISNSYATGSVVGDRFVGGLVGGGDYVSISISDSYATGSVLGGSFVGGLVGSNYYGIISNSYFARGPTGAARERRSFSQMRCPTLSELLCMPTEEGAFTYVGWETGIWNFGSRTELPQLLSNANPDLNLRPYIAGLAERIVGVGNGVSGFSNLVFEAGYEGPPGEPVTWSLAGLPDELSSYVYFSLANGTTATTTTGRNTTLSVTRNATQLAVGEGFYVVLMNSVSINGGRVRVRVVEATPPVIDGAVVQNRPVKESVVSTVLTFTAPEDIVSGNREALQWEFLVDGEPASEIGEVAQFVDSTTGSSVKVELNRPAGKGDFVSFVLRVSDPAGASTMVNVNIIPECAGGGKDLETRQDGDGTSTTPYRIWTLCQLQDVRSNPSAYYELVADIDARPANTWNVEEGEPRGFEPIALGIDGRFTGSFVNGGGHVISSLYINRPNEDNVGLFSRLAAGATIRKVILMDARTTGLNYVGSLVGYSEGVILDSSATGSVSGDGYVGGLVGGSDYGSISNSYATGSVVGSYSVGGLVGGSDYGGISISNSYATGSVVGSYSVGGLVGSSGYYGGISISNSYATGSVVGSYSVGGLVGGSDYGSISISNSYATGSVVGSYSVGGLVGGSDYGSISISNSYATGSVVGSYSVGGLVGSSGYYGGISNSYATGSVVGGSFVGGLVGGSSYGGISNSYATGSVTGTDYNVGGLVGYSEGGSISNSYFARGPTGAAGERRSFSQMRCPTLSDLFCMPTEEGAFTYEDWNTDTQVWNFGSETELPQLLSNDNPDLNLRPYIAGPGERIVGVGNGVSGFSNLVFEAGYEGPPGKPATLSWSLAGLPTTLRGLVYFMANGTTATTTTGRNTTLSVTRNATQLAVGEGFYVVFMNSVSVNVDRVQVRAVEARQPSIVGDAERIVGVGTVPGITRLNLEVANPGYEEDSVIFTWSFPELPTTLRGLVYFDLGGGKTGIETIGQSATLVVVRNERLPVPGNFVVELTSNIPDYDATSLRVRIVRATTPPMVIRREGEISAEDGGLIRTIWRGSTNSTLTVAASDPYGDDFGDLSWSFVSTDDLTPGATVEFSGSTMGDVVELRVTRPLDLYDVGSFVLRITSGSDLYTTVTVVIATGCSAGRGRDLGLEQAGDGTSGSPYKISRLCQLQDVRSSPSAYYELAADIDASPTSTWNEGKGFEPIALGIDGRFTGSFVNGGGHVISSLYINRPNEDNVGLFSRLAAGATIRKVILMDARTTGLNYVGSLVGYSEGVILDSSATGSVSGDGYVGGLVGGSDYGSISNSYATGSVVGSYSVGGLVGGSDYGGISISNSYATGSVSGDGYVGGLVGGSDYGSISISNSYATGSVVGSYSVGGLVGSSGYYGGISNSYATGSVTGTDYNVGGLVGSSGYYGGISNSYATGSVTGTDYNVGGLVGYSESGSISNSYFARGPTGAAGERRSFSQMRCPTLSDLFCMPTEEGAFTYEDWNTDTQVWNFGSETELPQLLSNDNPDLNLRPYIAGPGERIVGVGNGVSGFSNLVFEAGYEGPPGKPATLSWSLAGLPTTLRGLVYFMANGTTATTTTGRNTTLSVTRNATQLAVGEGFYVVFMNSVSVNVDRVQVRAVEARQPSIVGDAERIVGVGTVPGITRLNLEVANPGYEEDSVIFTWSFPELPTTLRGLVYFDLGGGKTGIETIGQSATLVVVRNERLPVPGNFVVELTSNIPDYDATSLRVRIVRATTPPMVIRREGEISAEDGGLIRTIWRGSTNSTLTVAASDPYGDDFGDLSWSFVSRDIASSVSVVFSGSTMGDVVELRVTRPLDLYDVGSFVLRITSGSDLYTTVTVVIATGCSAGRGRDLGLEQAGDGTSGSPYKISRLCQLQDVRSSPSAYYELAADIDASPTSTWNEGKGFEPIALGIDGRFTGSFVNGGGHVISSLYINRPNEDNVGLFSRLAAGATIRKVILMDARTTGLNYVGSLVGYSEGVILDSSATGSVSGDGYVGGLVGGSDYGSISNSYATGSVVGSYSVGGLVGGSDYGGISISNSYATGSVSGDGYVGGLVGGSDYGSISISNSYATGSVVGSYSVGGLVGSSGYYGGISNSYATGSVTGTDYNVGGLVGSSGYYGGISNSYATGSVTGTDYNVGGLVGYSESGSISNSYFARGPTGAAGERRSFSQMRCPTLSDLFCMPTEEGAFTYEDWNTDTQVWNFGSETELPQLLSNGNPDLNFRPYIAGPGERIVGVGNGVSGFSNLVFEAGYEGPPGKPATLSWSLAGLPTTLRGLVYFMADGSTATTATTATTVEGPSATLLVPRNVAQLAVGEGFYVVLMNGVSVNVDRVRVRAVEAEQASIAGAAERVVLEGTVPGTTSLDFKVANAGYGGESAILTWSLAGLPSTLEGLVYFDLGGDTFATTASGRIARLVITRQEGFPVPASFDVLLMNDVSVYAAARVGVRVVEEGVEEGRPVIAGSTVRTVVVGKGVSGFSDLVFEADYSGTPRESAILTWSLAGLPEGLSSYVYFNLANGTTATTATGSNTTLSVTRNADRLVDGTSFYVVLMSGVSTSSDLVQVRAVEEGVEEGRPVIVGSMVRTVVVGKGVSGFSDLVFEADYSGTPRESAILTWSLAGLPEGLSSYVYFNLANGTTATTATGSNTTLTVTRNADRLVDGTSFYVVLMSGVSTGSDLVQVQAVEEGVEEGRPVIAGSTVRTVVVGKGVSGFSDLVFEADYSGTPRESAILTWSLAGLPEGLSSYVYFSLANGTTATTATGSNTTLTVTRNADRLVDGTSFYVVLMSGVSTGSDLVQVQAVEEGVEEGRPVIAGSTVRTVVVGKGVSGFSDLVFEAGYSGTPRESAILTWSLAGLPEGLSSYVYFNLANGTTATTATGSNTTLTVIRNADRLVDGTSFHVVLMSGVSTSSDLVQVRAVEVMQATIAGAAERVVLGGTVPGTTTSLDFKVANAGYGGESAILTWLLSGLPDELSDFVYFDLGGGTFATIASGPIARLVIIARQEGFPVPASFDVLLVNDVSVYAAARVRVRVVEEGVEEGRPVIAGSTVRTVVVGKGVSGFSDLVFEADYSGTPRESAILTWSLAGLPEGLSSYVYFNLANGTTATTATGSNTTLTVTRNADRLVDGTSFHVVLMSGVSTSSDLVQVRAVEEGVEERQPIIAGSDERIAAVGNGVSGFSNLVFVAAAAEPSEESIIWTWSLSGLPDELSSYVYFSLANGTAATTATGSNTTLSVTRNAGELAAGTSFAVVLMNGVSTSRASVRIQTVDARQATIDGSTERVVLEGTVPGTTSLDFEVADAGYGEGSAILTWSLAGLPDELSNFVYFDLGDGATATTARGSIAKLVITRHEGFPVPASFDVLLMNNVSVYASARVRVRVVAEGQPVIAGSTVRTVVVGNGVSGFSNLVFVAADAEPSEESIIWTWSLSGLSGELSSYVYFSLANGTAATTATGSNTTLSVTRNAAELAAGTSFEVVLMNGVSTSRDLVQVQAVEAQQATIAGSTERVVLEGTVPGTTSLDFEVADAGYGEGSAILTWSLAGLPDELSNFIYFDLGDGATATTARGSIAKLVITRHEGFPVPASFDVLLMNNVSVYASARVRVRVVAEGQPVIVGSTVRTVVVGNGVSGFEHLDFEVDDRGSSEESISWTWSLAGLSGELSSYVYFSLANGTAATTATGSNTTLSVTRNAGELAAGTSFAVVLMNGVSTSRASVRIQTVDARQATIDGSTERVVLEGTVPGTTSLDFEVADAGYGEGSAILTWSLAGLPDELSNFVYFDLGDGATATTARGSIAKLVITRHEGFPVPASFDVLLMNNVSVYASARVRVRVVAEGQPVIAGSTARTVAVGNGVSGFSNLVFVAAVAEPSEESIIWTWSLSGLSGELSSYVYFSLANGTAATTATGSNTTLSVTRNADELAAGTSFAVVLMNGVSTSRASVRIQTVDARQATIDGSTERVVLEGTVPGTTSLDFEVADAGYGEGSAILTWSLAGLPDELSNFVYFDLGDGATATTARGSIAKLVITRHEGFPVPASFDVLLMNNVSVYASARVRVRVVAEGQPVIAGSTVRTVTVGNGVSGFEHLDFEVDDRGSSEESIIWTWSLSGLSGELSSYVYFSLANGTAATTATGSNTTLSVTRNADELAAGTSFAVVLMNGVSTSRASVRIQTVDARQATIDGSTERVVLEGTVPGTTSLDFEVADAGYGEGSAILTWSLAGLPDELSNFVYFDLGDGATATTARGSIAKLVITRHEGFPVPASFDVLLMNDVSVYASARVRVRVVAEGQPVIAGSTVRTVVVGNGVSGFEHLDFEVDDRGSSEESITWTWSLSGLSGELSSYVYFSLANGTAATTATGSNTTLSVTRNADELAAGTSFAVVLMNGVSTSRASVRIQTVDARQATIDGSTERVVLEGTVPGTTSLDFEVADAGYGEGSAILTWSLAGLPDELSNFVYFDLGDGATARGSIAKLVITRHEGFPVPASFDVLLMNDVSVYAPARVGVRVVAEGQPVIAGSTVRTVVVGNGVSGFEHLDFEVDDRGSSEESIIWTWSLSGLSGELSSYVYFSLANGTAATTATGSNTTLSVTRNADELAAGTSFAVVLMNGVSTSRASVQVRVVEAQQATIAGSTERVVLEGTVPGTTSLDFEVADAGYGGGSAILTWSLSELPSTLTGLVYFDLGDGATATTARGSIAKLVITRHEGFPVPASFDVLLMNDVSVYAPARVGVRVVAEGQPVIAGSTVRTVVVGNGVSGFSNLVFVAAAAEPSEESIIWTWSLSGLSGELSSYVYFSLANGTAATTATGSNTTLSVTRNAAELAAGTSFEVVLMNGVSTSRDLVQVQAVEAQQATIAGAAERVVRVGTVPAVSTSLDFEVANAGYGGESAFLTWSLSELPSTLTGLVYFDLGGGTTATTASGSSAKLVVARSERLPVPASFDVLLANDVSVYAAARVRVLVVEEEQPVIAGLGERVVAVWNGVSDFRNLNFELDDTGSSGESITWTWLLSGLSEELSGFVYFSLADGTTATTASGSVAKLVIVRNEGLPVSASFEVLLTNDVSTSRDSVQVRIMEVNPPMIGEGGIFTEGGSLIRMIWEGSTDSTLIVGARDPDGGGADDLSWSFVSRDDIAPGASVEFSGSTMGDIVELRVTRPLGLYGVGSFVLRVESGFGAYTTVNVSIVTVCSEVRGRDLMSGQTGDGTSGSPYQISRLCQLQDVRSSPSAYYELAADIDASPTRNWNDGEGFEPIASDPVPRGGFNGSFLSSRAGFEPIARGTNGGFSGSFVNSSNRVITGLTINRPNTDNVGLFSRLATGATIRGVILMDGRTTGNNNVGSLVGNNQGMILDTHATSSVSGDENVGGLAGSVASSGTISNSYATGSVEGDENVGGLAGSVGFGASISVSFATGAVSGDENVGGLAGSVASFGTISNSYATGSVEGDENVGGLAGYNEGRISNSFAVGSISGTTNFGGLAGSSTGDAVIDASYSTGSENGFGVHLTPAQLQCPEVSDAACSEAAAIYKKWDPDIWNFGSTGSPTLQTNPPPATDQQEQLRIRVYLGGAAR